MVDTTVERDNELISKNGCNYEMKSLFPDPVMENCETKLDPDDTKCGFICFHPKWLQIFASKKAFVIIYSMTGMQLAVYGAYHIGIMSTMEKAFNMSSCQSGFVTAGWNIGTFFASIFVTYIAAKGHRTRWVAAGSFLLSAASVIRMLPYYIYGGGEVIKMYTKEYNNSNSSEFTEMSNNTTLKRLSTNVLCQKDNNYGNSLTFYIMFAAQIIVGMGGAVYWTCGVGYLDDNVRKNLLPALLAIVQFIRLFGPTVGFLLSSYALKIYVEPTLTPLINHEDSRWVGAWWLGWYPLCFSSFLMAFLFCLFPRSLPSAAARRKQKTRTSTGVLLSDFKQAITRIRKNKIVVYNSLSSVCFTMGLMAFWTFMPKYMESQFRLSPSKSNFLTGTVSILCSAIGVMAAGLIISKVRPSPRNLAGWNVFVEILDIIGHILYTFLSCPPLEYHGHWNIDHSWNLTEICNANLGCGTDIQFSPVCDLQTSLTYYSWCHAGCNTTKIVEGVTEYAGCSCTLNSSKVVNGACPADCSANIFLFILIMAILSFTSATGRAANTLIQFRSVEERDKSLSIGVTESLLSLLAFIPSPIIYGMMMDWTCIVWGDNCGETGNCWLYDNQRLRLLFNLSASGFLLLGTLLDCFVWYHIKGLKLYDEDFASENDEKSKLKTPIVKTNIEYRYSKPEIELSMIKVYTSVEVEDGLNDLISHEPNKQMSK